jgi:photosystem II stability/assembly factor-like uncharacterized protein
VSRSSLSRCVRPASAWPQGDYGAVIKTSDHGRTWRRTNQRLAAQQLVGIALLDDKTAVAVGGSMAAVILETNDGGATWKRRNAGSALRLNAVAFADRMHGIAVGLGGTVVVTADGGTTWRQEPRRTAKNLSAVVMDANGQAIVGGEGGLVFRYALQSPASTLMARGGGSGE